MGVRIVLSELRSNFWILRGRQAIKKALHNCLPCKAARAKCDKQIEAPLPAERLIPCKPFDTTGIDFAGPVYVRGANAPKKSYIALFACSITRALHIELVSDLTTDTFIMALQRFVGRRGLPHTFIVIYKCSAVICRKWYSVEIHCATRGLVGRLVGEVGWDH
ncbi:hypothetical protein JTE90_025463 [Oedothorax gibbosus]|uniref:Integrase zinc-binding domain-containing protein n=1 Tax=Oedothorax gibbosus TaxID=931172 RepID=A0AAV6UZV4_9ARAC|nr:hypothetical protein JTE90_025463 [Oedothorax gibbosus]